MNLSFEEENKKKLTTLIVSLFLIFGITFTSCDVNKVEDQAKLIDVQSQKAQLDSKFSDLSNDLRDANQATVTPEMFKEVALRHLAGVKKEDKNFSEASANYDEGYEQTRLRNLGNELASQSSKEVIYNVAITELSSKIKALDSFEKANQVFNDFYSETISDDSYTVEEKNNLLSTAVYFQSTLDFLSTNYDLFRLEKNSITLSANTITEEEEEDEEESWWSSWGKCAAGTVGSAIGAAAAGGLAPAATCTVVLPGIGTVACGTVGAVSGGISGALVGAAEFCD